MVQLRLTQRSLLIGRLTNFTGKDWLAVCITKLTKEESKKLTAIPLPHLAGGASSYASSLNPTPKFLAPFTLIVLLIAITAYFER